MFMKKHFQQNASSRRLLILIGLSLLLHSILLFHWSATKPLLEFDHQFQNLALNLEPIEIIGQQQAHRKAIDTSTSEPVNISTPVSDKSLTALQSSARQQTRQETSLPGKTRQDQLQQAASESMTPSMNRARILSQIRHDLSQYFYYPPHARRKGMQGTVLLSFEISGQGAVHDIRVVKSSGYAILDLAAQDAMQRLDKLSWYAALMRGREIDLELPVIFRLTEG